MKNDQRAVFEKQAKWQVSRASKTWSEKLKQSIIMRQAQEFLRKEAKPEKT